MFRIATVWIFEEWMIKFRLM